MRTDRPRRENSQLMKWAHRSVPEEVKMQGELYGLHVCDTAAAFTSRFHALSDTPGIRCHALTKDNISDSAFIDIIKQENPNLKTDSLHAGRLVPLTGGELFACVTGNGITQIHADINAAQNLQRRFWTRHKTAFRLPSKKVTLAGDELWVPRSMGKRLKGALGSYGQLVPTGHESGSCRWEKISGARWRKLVGETNDEDTDSTPEELLDLAGIEDEMLERSGEITTFFRDPSGLLLPVDLWYPAKTFWSIVKTKTVAAINS